MPHLLRYKAYNKGEEMKYILSLCALICLAPTTMYSAVKQVGSVQEYQDIIHAQKNVVVCFSATWCHICKSIKAPFIQLSEQPEFKHITFINVDFDQHKKLSKKHNVVGVPTFILYHNGKEVYSETGVEEISTFKRDFGNRIRKHLINTNGSSDAPDMETRNTDHTTYLQTGLGLYDTVSHAIRQTWDSIKKFFGSFWTTEE